MFLHASAVHPFLWLRGVPLYGETTTGLATHPMMDIQGVSSLGLFQIKLL